MKNRALLLWLFLAVWCAHAVAQDDLLFAGTGTPELLLKHVPGVTLSGDTTRDHSGIPNCAIPGAVRLTGGKQSLMLTLSEDEARVDESRFEIKIYEVSPEGYETEWNTLYLFTGKTINTGGLKDQTRYHIFIRRWCGGYEYLYEGASKWVDAGFVTTDRKTNQGRGNQDCEVYGMGQVTFPTVSTTWAQMNWSGTTPVYNEHRFKLYVVLKGGQPTQGMEYNLFDGNTYKIDGLKEGTEYDVYYRIIWGGSYANHTNECEPVLAGQITTTTGVGSSTSCNTTNFPPVSTNGTPLPSLNVGDYILVSSFPMKVTAINGGNGIFTGEGEIGLPFGSKTLAVEFANIRVNIEYHVTSGLVKSKTNTALSGQYLNLPPIRIGGDICVDKSPKENEFDSNGINRITGKNYDPRGFDASGKYIIKPPYKGYSEGDPFDDKYDPRGFDANGNYVLGGKYNEYGCDVNGKDSLGNDCTKYGPPYHWLQDPTDSVTEAGLALAKSVSDSLKSWAVRSLSLVKKICLDSVTSIKLECNGVRAPMNQQLSAIESSHGIEKYLLVGVNDELLQEGMVKQYTSDFDMTDELYSAIPDIKAFQQRMVSLYRCDYRLEKFKVCSHIADSLSSNGTLGQVVEKIRSMIKKMSEAEALNRESQDSMRMWIFNFINREVNRLYTKYPPFYDLGMNTTKKHSIPNLVPQSISRPTESMWIASLEPLQEEISPYEETFSSNAKGRFFKVNTNFWDLYNSGVDEIAGVHKAEVVEALAKINLYEFIGGATAIPAPLTVSKEVLGRTYSMYLDNFRFQATSAFVDVYFVLEIPSSGDKLGFSLKDVSINPSGFLNGKIRMQLQSQVKIRVNNAMRLTLANSTNTFVQFDCSGFDGMGIEAELEICRNYLIPLDPITRLENTNDSVLVKGNFIALMPAWGEFMTTINLTPFMIKGVDNMRWNVQNASFDLSDLSSPVLNFPPQYQNSEIVKDLAKPEWKGIAIQSISVEFVSEFKKDPVSLTVQNVIIDRNGFSGMVKVSPVLTDGNLGGWKFKIDTLGATVLGNQLAGCFLTGAMEIPLFKSNNSNDPNSGWFPYRAQYISKSNYEFAVMSNEQYKVNLWAATATIASASVTVKKDALGWFIGSDFSGSISVDAKNTSLGDLKLPELRFYDLQLSNRSPYMSSGSWEISNTSLSLGGFSVSLDSIRLVRSTESETKSELRMVAKVIFDSDRLKIGAAGKFAIKGALDTTTHNWNLESIGMSALCVNVSVPAFKIRGCLEFYKGDPIFGSGFQGIMEAEFPGLSSLDEGAGLGITAMAMFGKAKTSGGNEYEYFLVDALINLKKGINLGQMSILALGGGASNRMRRIPNTISFPEEGGEEGAPLNIPPLGTSLSGTQYLPDSDMSLSFKANAVIATTLRKEIFNANVEFGIGFFEGGGISEIYFSGNGRLMAPVDLGGSSAITAAGVKPPSNVPISARVELRFDAKNKVFTGNIEVFVNAGSIKGMGSGGQFVKAELHFEKAKWYVLVGKPKQRAGLLINVAGLNVESSTYFCAGNALPEECKVEGVPYSPTGFMFGVGFDLQFKTKAIIFYAEAGLEAGFDIVINKYGTGTICTNNDNEPIGINGWYAVGRVYVGLNAEVGIDIGFRGKRFKGPIFSVNAKAEIITKLPNPFYAKGVFRGSYNLFFGLLKGSCNLQFEVGKQCEMAVLDQNGNPSSGNSSIYDNIISEMYPAHLERAVPVDATPKVLFNVPLNEEFECGDELNKTCLVRLESLELKAVSGQTKYSGNITFPSSTELNYHPYRFLRGNDSILFKVNLGYYENGTKITTISKEHKFFTAEMFNYIPKSNIANSYPSDGQYNFYKGMSKEMARLELGKSQNEFFEKYNDIEYHYVARIENVNGFAHYTDFTVKNAQVIEYKLPLGALQPDGAYKVTLEVKKKTEGGIGLGEPAGAQYYSSKDAVPYYKSLPLQVDMATLNAFLDKPSPGIDLGVANTNGEDNSPSGIEIYSLYFRVSDFNSIIDKYQSIFASRSFKLNGNLIESTLSSVEYFDEFETSGDLKFEFTNHRANTWMKDNCFPLLYDYYPSGDDPIFISPVDRNMESGIPPSKIGVLMTLENPLLCDGSVYNGARPHLSGSQLIGLNFSDIFEDEKEAKSLLMQQLDGNSKESSAIVKTLLGRCKCFDDAARQAGKSTQEIYDLNKDGRLDYSDIVKCAKLKKDSGDPKDAVKLHGLIYIYEILKRKIPPVGRGTYDVIFTYKPRGLNGSNTSFFGNFNVPTN